jgi:hypothetical protein
MAFLILVNMSATWSVDIYFFPLHFEGTDAMAWRLYSFCFVYQLAFTTPGIIPESAICRKQILHRPNLRR